MTTQIHINRLKRMTFHQKCVMLQMLGIPNSQRPSKVAGLDEKLVEFNESRPEEVARWYNIIALGKVEGELPSDIKDVVNRAKEDLTTVLQSATTQTVVEQATEYLKEKTNAAQADLIRHAKEALSAAAEHYRPIVIKSKGKPKKVQGVFPDEFERILQLASQRIPIMLVGPAGCGKTYISAKIGEALGLESYDQSCSEGISESTFTGWLLPVGNSGRFEYVPSPFITAYENGGVFLLDEMDSADANLLTFLNKAIANDYFYLPQRYKNPKVIKHPDFVVIAAANTFGSGADAQYVGRNALDAATLDRFQAGLITMDYSAPVEEALIDGDILEWGRNIRVKIKRHNLSRIMSTRIMLDLTKMKEAYGWDQNDWDQSYFASWTADEKRLVA